MTIFRRLMIFFIAVFLVGFYFGPKVIATYFSPGSQDDPLVTKKWVDNYIEEQVSPISEQALILASRIKTLDSVVEQFKSRQRPTIILTIGSKTGYVDEVPHQLEAAPFLVSGRTLLPLRFVGEAFGINFTWDEQSKTVTYPSPNGQVVLTVGEKTALVGEGQVTLDAEGRIAAGRTFVPLRFIGESLGAEVTWHGEQKKAEIR
ncbi:MAG: copper amine oxidase N-terminal domain-containing protein [Dehalobacterium sp.]